MELIAAVAILLGVQPSQDPSTEVTSTDRYVETLIRVLETRDEAIRDLLLPYVVTFIRHEKPDETSVQHTGVWARVGLKQAVKSVQLTYRDHGWVRISTSHSVWDGTQCETLVDNEVNRARKLTIRRTIDGSQFHLQLPQLYGLEWCFGPWPATLRRWRARAAGEEVIQGRRCLRLIFDTSRDGTDGSKPNTWMAWLDDRETFLVWKCQSLTLVDHLDPTQAVGQDTLAKLGITINGRTFVPDMDMQLVSAEPFKGVWIPIEATLTQPAIRDSGLTRIHVDRERVALDKMADVSLFAIPRGQEMVVKDKIREEQYYVDPAIGEISLLEMEFEDLLTKVSHTWSAQVSARPTAPQRLDEASCGPKSAYFWLRLNGFSANVNDLLDRLPAKASPTDLGMLTDFARRSGADVEAVKMTMHDLGQLAGVPIIAVLRSLTRSHGKDSPDGQHFVVAQLGSGGVELASLPEGHYRLSTSDFEASWTGFAMVDSKALGRLKLTSTSRGVIRTLVYIAALVAATLSLFVFFALWKRRRTLASPTIAAMCLCVLSLALDGCQRRPESSSVSSRHDIGTVQEGDFVDVVLDYRNSTSKDQRIALRSSCGCVSTKVTETWLTPGKSTVIRARVNTLGRSGNIHEFIDIIDTSTRVHSFWIVGKVLAKARVLPAPGSIDLGQVRVNEEITKPLTVEMLTNGESMELGCKVLESELRNARVTLIDKEDTSMKGDTFKRRLVSQGQLQFRGLKPGLFSEFVLFTAVDKDNIPRTQGRMLVTAHIVGEYVATPMSVFAGALKREVQARVIQISVQAVGCPVGQPTVKTTSDWLRVDSVKAATGCHTVTIILDTLKAPSGLFDESIRISWGDTIQDVPVRGRIG